MRKQKRPLASIRPDTSKTPRIAVDPSDFYRQRPAWRMNLLQLAAPYGWQALDADTLDKIRQKLVSFESMTWREILVDAKRQHHAVKIYRLNSIAQKRLEEIFGAIDIDQLISLRLGSTERVWGLLQDAVLLLIWWDPDHEICPSLLKHT